MTDGVSTSSGQSPQSQLERKKPSSRHGLAVDLKMVNAARVLGYVNPTPL